MSLTSTEFFLFVFTLLVVYYSIPRYQWQILLVGNILFLSFTSVSTFLYLLFSTISSYICAGLISKNLKTEQKLRESGKKESTIKYNKDFKKQRKNYLVLFSIIYIGILIIFKSKGIFQNAFMISELTTPIGISYFSLVIIGYLYDVYNEKYEAESDIFHYTTIITFFPALYQGPINRVNELKEEIFVHHIWNYTNVKRGLQRAVWGLFKKLVLANRIAVFVNGVYDNLTEFSGSIILIASVLYVIQLYADFSGYMDIALGIGEMFGIRLPENFKQPFISKNVTEFWHRWHITLGTWFRDYLMFPFIMSKTGKKLNKFFKIKFGKEKGKNIIAYLGTFLVWGATGIWHGLEPKFLAWGLYYAVLIILAGIASSSNHKTVQKLKKNKNTLLIMRTMFSVLIGDIIFRVNSLKDLCLIFYKLGAEFDINGIWRITVIISLKEIIILALCCIAAFIVFIIHCKGKRICNILEEHSVMLRWGVYLVAIWSIYILGLYGQGYSTEGFAYMRF